MSIFPFVNLIHLILEVANEIAGDRGGGDASFTIFRYLQLQQQNANYFFPSTNVIIFSFM